MILKTISDIEPILTGHGVGEKRVLLSMKEFSSAVTQIAQTRLKAGEMVEKHCHPTMDEHFIFLKGECRVIADGETVLCRDGHYLLVPAGVNHEISVLSETEMLTIGVATE